MRVETVKKADDKAPGGFVVVNKKDFNEKTDKVFAEKKPAEKKPAEKKPAEKK